LNPWPPGHKAAALPLRQKLRNSMLVGALTTAPEIAQQYACWYSEGFIICNIISLLWQLCGASFDIVS